MGRASPPEWRQTVSAIQKMRSARDAPVDTMGCHMLAAPNATPKDFRFQTLVALMLSSQTKDEITAAAMKRLHSLPLTVEKVLETPEERLAELVYPVGFYRRKASFIKRVSGKLQEDCNGDIPDTLEGLQELPGIGPKMACLVMQNAWKKNVGIGVDVHVHRICNRLGWVKTKTPEETRFDLEDWLPRELWNEINPLLVGFGQTVCLPVKPKCSECLLKNTCPSAKLFLSKPHRGNKRKEAEGAKEKDSQSDC